MTKRNIIFIFCLLCSALALAKKKTVDKSLTYKFQTKFGEKTSQITLSEKNRSIKMVNSSGFKKEIKLKKKTYSVLKKNFDKIPKKSAKKSSCLRKHATLTVLKGKKEIKKFKTCRFYTKRPDELSNTVVSLSYLFR